MKRLCIDKYLLLIPNYNVLILECLGILLELGLHRLFFLLFVLQVALLLQTKETVEIGRIFENVLDRGKFHVMHLYHYFEFLILQYLFHIRYLFELLLFDTLCILLQLFFDDLTHLSLLQNRHVALVINLFDSANASERIIDAFEGPVFKIFSSRRSNHSLGASTSIENSLLQLTLIHQKRVYLDFHFLQDLLCVLFFVFSFILPYGFNGMSKESGASIFHDPLPLVELYGFSEESLLLNLNAFSTDR